MNIEDNNGTTVPDERQNTGYESLKSAQPIAIATLKRALKTGSTREQLDAAKTILNRTGLPEKTQVEASGTGPPIPTQTLQNVLISINQIFDSGRPGTGSPHEGLANIDFSKLTEGQSERKITGTAEVVDEPAEDKPQRKKKERSKITLGKSEKTSNSPSETTLKPIPSEFFTKADSDSEDYEDY